MGSLVCGVGSGAAFGIWYGSLVGDEDEVTVFRGVIAP